MGHGMANANLSAGHSVHLLQWPALCCCQHVDRQRSIIAGPWQLAGDGQTHLAWLAAPSRPMVASTSAEASDYVSTAATPSCA